MGQTYKRNWIDQLWKIPRAGTILVIIGIITPAMAIMESGVYVFLWYFGFWFLSANLNMDFGMASDFFNSPYDVKYMTIGIITIALLVISLILMSVSVKNSRYKKNYKVTAASSLIGGIMALIGIGAYYGYIDLEFNFWLLFDPSFGFYLPLVAGIVGVIGAIAAGYAISVDSKFPEERLITESVFKPQPINPPKIETGGSFQSQQETPKFCGNCGEKLIGPFCKVCGTKAEL